MFCWTSMLLLIWLANFSWKLMLIQIFKSLRFYSGVVAGAREAMICGVPSLSISLNWYVVCDIEFSFHFHTTICNAESNFWLSVVGRRMKAKKPISRMLLQCVYLWLMQLVGILRRVFSLKVVLWMLKFQLRLHQTRFVFLSFLMIWNFILDAKTLDVFLQHLSINFLLPLINRVLD